METETEAPSLSGVSKKKSKSTVKSTPPSTLFTTVRGVKEGLLLKADYVIEDFLEEGEQALLYGQPKVGKTFLAIQLAAAVATGSDFLNWRVPKPRKVLYINFEMGHRVFAQRVAGQFPALEHTFTSKDQNGKIEMNAEAVETALNGFLTFTVDPRSINILSADYVALQNLIKAEEPSLIIIDTLSKIHQVDERANELVGRVLTEVRRACTINKKPIAHIIVHHARKASMNMDDRGGYLTAHEIRGASAIRGEADLIIGLAKTSGGSGGGARHSLILEARNVAVEDLDIEFHDGKRFEVSKKQLKHIVADLLKKKFESDEGPIQQSVVCNDIAKELEQPIASVEATFRKWIKDQTGSACCPNREGCCHEG